MNPTGWSYAQFNLPPAPGTWELEIDFAYCLGWPWEFVSNPVQVVVIDLRPGSNLSAPEFSVSGALRF